MSRIQQLLTRQEIFHLIGEDLARVEREIGTDSISSVDAITAIGQYLQASGGKRLRPALLLLAARACGPQTGALQDDLAIRLGAVVELIHTATLVHDDVIDSADTRRGRPSTNSRWGNHISVLAGDWLYMQAFTLSLRERSFHVLDLLTNLTQMMVEGELLQLDHLGKIRLTAEDYFDLVNRKTACLFGVCARLGAVAAGAKEKTEALLGEYGWNLGMAFQLVDDILDFTSSAKKLGKPVGSDLREGKVTLPLILALDGCTEGERAAVETVLRERAYHSVSLDTVLDLLEKYQGVAQARRQAEGFAEKARQLTAELPESVYKTALHSVTELIVDRES
ncbi:MAG TPA: polyprenyl synthetase family protein [Bryobacterales bacterium]|nr:polyprenyl synthetase family protein [Bryobacterales bacterium]